jgi:pimeloyl-ACP methyl ester carboxylesterase
VTQRPSGAASSATASGYWPVDGLDLYYEVHGTGRPLVLLHGAMGTIESCFAALLPRLAETHTVVATELQGHGHTADIDRPLSMSQLADDTAGLIHGLGIPAADLVGYSLGGGVALQLAISHPELVGRLVFAGGTSYRRDGLHPDMLEETDADLPDLDGTVWQQAYARVAPDPSSWPALVAKVAQLDRTFEGWTPEDISSIRAPTLLIIGDADIVRPEHTVEMFRLLGGGLNGDLAGIPAARLAVLPGTSHTGVLERTDWLASMILEFLATD